MCLHLQNGFWILSEKTDEIWVKCKMWYDRKLPHELAWEGVIVHAVWVLYPKNRCMILKIPPNNPSLPGELEPAGFVDDDDNIIATMYLS